MDSPSAADAHCFDWIRDHAGRFVDTTAALGFTAIVAVIPVGHV
jgi:hypothetical protein